MKNITDYKVAPSWESELTKQAAVWLSYNIPYNWA